MANTETVKLLEARLYFRTWTGVLQLALIETGPNAGLAYSIETYSGGPKRTLGVELSIDRVELRDVTGHAIKSLEPPR